MYEANFTVWFSNLQKEKEFPAQGGFPLPLVHQGLIGTWMVDGKGLGQRKTASSLVDEMFTTPFHVQNQTIPRFKGGREFFFKRDEVVTHKWMEGDIEIVASNFVTHSFFTSMLYTYMTQAPHSLILGCSTALWYSSAEMATAILQGSKPARKLLWVRQHWFPYLF